jgi:hypothetical protein
MFASGGFSHRRHGAAEAEERLVEGTRKGCDHYGVPEKFDEHMTRLWARAISNASETLPSRRRSTSSSVEIRTCDAATSTANLGIPN